jgi:cyclopropane fatty-acyl-phospholipid synthase-like methyltransferase
VKPYSRLPGLYDLLMDHVDYVSWARYLTRLAHLFAVPEMSVLDLGCGTGTLMRHLAELQWAVAGVDSSSEMLSIAYDKLADLGVPRLLQQDIKRLNTGSLKFGAVTATCGTLNYLPTESLAGLFKRVARSLLPGGLFLFDVEPAARYSRKFGGTTYTGITDNLAYIWDTSFDPAEKRCEQNLTFFESEGALYRRFEEQHVLFVHDRRDIVAALTNAGLEDGRVFEFGTFYPDSGSALRLQYVARRSKLPT